MSSNYGIVLLLQERQRNNPSYRISRKEIKAVHAVLARLARLVLNKPGKPLSAGRRVYHLIGGCHE